MDRLQPRIIPYVRLWQTVIGKRFPAGLIGFKSLAFPTLVAGKSNVCGIENNSGLSAVHMREARLAEVPQQQAHVVVAFL